MCHTSDMLICPSLQVTLQVTLQLEQGTEPSKDSAAGQPLTLSTQQQQPTITQDETQQPHAAAVREAKPLQPLAVVGGSLVAPPPPPVTRKERSVREMLCDPGRYPLCLLHTCNS